ncbi:MAG: hypothetical protein IT331_15080 [Anaerolineae bacterium]|nr:hypothetical protein [Anaerolineae bacterium]
MIQKVFDESSRNSIQKKRIQERLAVVLGLTLMDWISYCPTTCPRLPIYYLVNALNLGLGLAASVILVIQLRKPIRSSVR